MTITRKEFVDRFNEPSGNELDARAERLCNYLRSYALTINDHTFTEAADLIDELYGLWFVAEEQVGSQAADEARAEALADAEEAQAEALANDAAPSVPTIQKPTRTPRLSALPPWVDKDKLPKDWVLNLAPPPSS